MQLRHIAPTLLTLLLFSAPAHASWFVDAAQCFHRSDNLNFSATDPRADSASTSQLSLGSQRLLGQTQIRIAADVQRDLLRQYQGLNRYIYGASAAVRQSFGSVDRPLLLTISVNRQSWDYRDNQRDSDWLAGSLRLERAIANGLRASMHSDWQQRSGTTSEVFEQRKNLVGVELNYDFLSNWQVQLGYDYLYGDIDTACSPEGDGPKSIDATFSSCVQRVDSQIHSGFLDLNYLLSPHTALSLNYRRDRGGEHDFAYRANQLGLALHLSY